MSDRLERAAGRPSSPFVTVVVLNYNAGPLLVKCLESLLLTEYSSDAIEIIVVDNASSDGSPQLVRGKFPSVYMIDAGANLGFSAGNNLAMREAPGPYVALVNPDTEVDPGWLMPLVDVLEADAWAGAAQPKLLLYEDRIPLRIQSSTFVPQNAGMGADERHLGVRVEMASAAADGRSLQIDFRSGFGAPEIDERGAEFRWALGDAELGIAAVGDGPVELSLTLSARGRNDAQVEFSALVGGECIHLGVVGAASEVFEIEIPPEARRHARPVVQNAGSFPLPDGSSRDRGTVVSWGNVYCDWDGPSYASPGEVFSFNGAGVLLRKSMLEEIGYFDEHIFLYYEDTDLAIRARRRGWRVVFRPESVIRHHHSAVAVEGSPLFTYNVARSRLYVILKHWPLDVAIRALAEHTLETLRSGLLLSRQMLCWPPMRPVELRRFTPRIRALRRFLLDVPAALAARSTERRAGGLDIDLFRPWFVDP